MEGLGDPRIGLRTEGLGGSGSQGRRGLSGIPRSGEDGLSGAGRQAEAAERINQLAEQFYEVQEEQRVQ